jgi:hypothetical protein
MQAGSCDDTTLPRLYRSEGYCSYRKEISVAEYAGNLVKTQQILHESSMKKYQRKIPKKFKK